MASLDSAYSGGPATWQEAFPPICIRTHYNPTDISKHILPTVQRNLPQDPRPSTKICTAYYSSSPGDKSITNLKIPKPPTIPIALLGGSDIPIPPDAAYYPPGGAASLGFPYSQYVHHINTEIDILRINEPLSRCAEKRYIPIRGLPAMATNRVPGAMFDNSSTLSPLVTDVSRVAGCRDADDNAAWNRSARLFYNPTRYDRTTGVPTTLKHAEGHLACKSE